uniref:TMEM205-like domain-containing protein n=1 Tax=Fusarium oxysporum (strain Fo5176) TaxID=660025 RepID=A0A0D2XXC3_FUSOF
MAIVTTLLAPVHLLSFSTLLGSQLYQTFIITKVTFKHLPRTPYINLQKNLFPIFFQGQALLLFLTAITLPPYGALSLIEHKSDWIPFAISGFVSGLNLMVFGPRTRQLMLDRVEQGKAVEGPSSAMEAIKKRFRTSHAMCIHLNLIGLGAHLWYTWRLASRLDFSL